QHGTGQTDARSDVYSLGVVLHRLLTLHDPGSTPFALPPLRQINPQATPEMAQIIERATKVQASDRFGSMDELRQALTGASTQVARPTQAAVSTQPAHRSRRSPALLIGPVVVVAVLVAGLAIGQRATNSSRAAPAPPLIVTPATEPTHTPTPIPTATPTPIAAVLIEPPPTPTLSPSNVHVQYVLDASNSMLGSLPGGRARIDVARSGLIHHWQSMKVHPYISLRAFGHSRSAVDAASCLDSEMLVSFGREQIEQLSAALSAVTPQGMSPLADALREASGDLSPAAGRVDAVILIADGGDNCGEDVLQMLNYQREVGLRFPIYVAGLAVDDDARQELRSIAELTGGQYSDVGNEDQLVQLLNRFSEEIEALPGVTP
ncbi:MAG: hypothetical protein KDI55_26950, partial [Anaerolineae bacterium]|nr:hypothetical protein [Anaerolineae bacterium]